jgi:hypothetical protein
MKESEAREWIDRYRKKAKDHGYGEANLWWADMIEKIEKTRGKKGADDLRARMNNIRTKNETSRKS